MGQRRPVGSLAIVLHGHIPWVMHHGRWPHGENWLLEAALEGKKWLVGDDVTLADFYVGAGFSYEPAAKMPLEPYKNIRAWNQRLLTVPAWLNTAPKLS